MTDPHPVLERIIRPGPIDDDPIDHEPDGYTTRQLERMADERADLEHARRMQ